MALTISTGLSGGTVGNTVLGVVTPKGAAGPVTYSIQSGSLAPGLKLNPSTGVISGTPTSATPSTAVVQATDGVTTATATVVTNPRSASQLPPGISLTTIGQIPQHWDPQWFAWFINSQLQYADVRNAISGTGIAIGTGLNGSPGATISLSSDASSAAATGVIATNTVLGNVSGATAAASALSQAQLTALVNVFTSLLAGVVPASGGGTTNFLRADGSWAAPPSGGTGANPTATIGLSAVNGVATTFMRSDAAPALGVGISPTWTGNHTFTPASGVGVAITAAASQLGLTVAGTANTNIVKFSDGTGNLTFSTDSSHNGYWGMATSNSLNFVTNNSTRMTIAADGGVTLGSPTGGDEGAGTINATGFYLNGLPLGTTQFNITPDLHPVTPTGVGLGPNDEFETGSSIDTAGTRYSSATAWTAFNIGVGTNSVAAGNLMFVPASTAGVSYSGYTQAVPGGSWTYLAKVASSNATANTLAGLVVMTASGSSGKMYFFGVNATTMVLQAATNSTTFSSNAATAAIFFSTGTVTPYVYLQVAYNSGTTTFVFSYSYSGAPGSFTTLLSVSQATFLGAAPGFIGLGTDNQGSGSLISIYDFFRRTA